MTGEALHWHAEAWVIAPLALSAALYCFGTARLWTRAGPGRGVTFTQAALFAAGWLSAGIALVSPLADLAERIFAAHMVEHELLMAAAAPLLVAARPEPAFAWAMPRTASALAAGGSWLKRAGAVLARPAIATVMHGLAIWIWHVPALFALTATSELAHVLQHASFFLTALFFWTAMLKPTRTGSGANVFWLFATAMHTNFLGALLVLSPRVWFPVTGGFGLTALEDQQLAGLIMWVPGGLVYAGAALVAAGTWIAKSGARSSAH